MSIAREPDWTSRDEQVTVEIALGWAADQPADRFTNATVPTVTVDQGHLLDLARRAYAAGFNARAGFDAKGGAS